MPYASVSDSVDIYYESEGAGIPLVFIHPPAMGHVTFKKQMQLANKYQVITYDIRGNGQSGFSNEPITIPLLANDLRLLLDHLEIKEAIICSYSNAGSIALEFALSYPERTQAVILSGGFPEVNSFLLEQQFRIGILTAKWKRIKLLATVLAKSHTSEKTFQKELYHYILKVNPQALYQLYNVGLAYNCTIRLSLLNKPILLVYGGKNSYIKKHCQLFQNYARQTETIIIGNANHQIPTKSHLEFNKIVDQFIEKLDSKQK